MIESNLKNMERTSQENILQRQLSRRRFLAGASAFAAGGVLVACGKSNDKDSVDFVSPRADSTISPEATRIPEGVYDIGDWQFGTKEWNLSQSREGWKTVFITGILQNTSDSIQELRSNNVHSVEAKFTADGFEYDAAWGVKRRHYQTSDILNSIEKRLQYLSPDLLAPGFGTQIGIIGEVPDIKIQKYSLKLANKKYQLNPYREIKKDTNSEIEFIGPKASVAKEKEAFEIENFAIVNFLGVKDEEVQKSYFRVKNNYGDDIEIHRGGGDTDTYMAAYLKNGTLAIHDLSGNFSRFLIPPGGEREFSLDFYNPQKYDFSGSTIVLMFRGKYAAWKIT